MEVQSYAHTVIKLGLKSSFEFGVRSGFSASSQLQEFFVPLFRAPCVGAALIGTDNPRLW